MIKIVLVTDWSILEEMPETVGKPVSQDTEAGRLYEVYDFPEFVNWCGDSTTWTAIWPEEYQGKKTVYLVSTIDNSSGVEVWSTEAGAERRADELNSQAPDTYDTIPKGPWICGAYEVQCSDDPILSMHDESKEGN
jgi:hypothetical protein